MRDEMRCGRCAGGEWEGGGTEAAWQTSEK